VVTLVEADEARALPLATGYIDAFVPMVCADRVKGARMLSGLRGQLSRRTEPSPLRNDIMDLLDARIPRFSDNEDDCISSRPALNPGSGWDRACCRA
jgi:hypothetical protein